MDENQKQRPQKPTWRGVEVDNRKVDNRKKDDIPSFGTMGIELNRSLFANVPDRFKIVGTPGPYKQDHLFEDIFKRPVLPKDAFPETRGPEITYVGGADPASGGKPSISVFDEAGILSRIRDLDHKRAGGVEPPALITAKEMADELESLPRSLVEVALDPQDTGEADIFLEELKRQGEGFAVAIERREEFEWNLMNMGVSKDFLGMKMVDPRDQIDWQDAAYKHFMSQSGVVVPDVPMFFGSTEMP